MLPKKLAVLAPSSTEVLPLRTRVVMVLLFVLVPDARELARAQVTWCAFSNILHVYCI